MGKQQSKVVKPNANVVNEVVVENNTHELDTIKLYLLLITIILSINFALGIYAMHNKRLKKKYYSRANDLDKI